MTNQERSAKGEGQLLNKNPRLSLLLFPVRERLCQVIQPDIQHAIAAARLLDLSQDGLQNFRGSIDRPKNVQADDIA